MDTKQQIRLNIGDLLQSAIDYFEIKQTGQTTFIMTKKGINSILAVKKDGVTMSTSLYSLSDNLLTVTDTLSIGEKLEVIYRFSCLSDVELDQALLNSGNNVTDASVVCIDWLLADAAKLFNYSTGDEDFSSSDIFDHLKDIRSLLKNNVQSQKGTVPRIYNLSSRKPTTTERDISRWDY